MSKLPIETENPLFGDYKYVFAKEIMEEQQDVSWTAQEIPVENDLHDFRHTMTAAQLNLSEVTLQSFVEIEQKVGDVWDEIGTWFPHSEIEACCKEMARMETSVHAFFYQKMSDVLNIEPEVIAENQRTIKVIKNKLDFIKKITSNLSDNKPLSLATVAMIEQVLLFSNFAMLKSYQSNGYNLATNTVTGVNFVVQDETIHGIFAGSLFLTYLDEDEKGPKNIDRDGLKKDILKVLDEIIYYEDSIIDYVFNGHVAINGITADDLKAFVRSRANDALSILGFEHNYEVEVNPIANWFYKGSKGITMHDFFVSGTSQYRRSWKTKNLSRLPYMKSGGDNE